MGWESWSKLSAPADGDLLAVQDVSDTTGDASGTTKYMELTDLFAAYIAAKVRTLLGFAAGEDDLGEFTGAIIPDDSDIKEALQALETAFADKADKAPAVNALGSERSGTGSADLEASSSQYFSRTDANLSSGFPGKSGETNKSFTIGCWFKAESFGEFNTLLSKYNGAASDRSWHLSVREVSSGSGTYSVQAQLGYNSGASSYDSAKHASTLSAGTWYFAAMSYDASDNSWAIRVRDSQCRDVGTDATDTATLDENGLSITDADFKIGALGATTQFFDGLIDKAFVYNEASGESEIEAICGTTRRSRPGAILLGW